MHEKCIIIRKASSPLEGEAGRGLDLNKITPSNSPLVRGRIY